MTITVFIKYNDLTCGRVVNALIPRSMSSGVRIPVWIWVSAVLQNALYAADPDLINNKC